jgi:hypothetical protein
MLTVMALADRAPAPKDPNRLVTRSSFVRESNSASRR